MGRDAEVNPGTAILTMPCCCPGRRPFDAAKQTNATGGWEWVDLPQSTLLNNLGMFSDCAMGPFGNTKPIACSPTLQWVPPGRSQAQPWASPTNKGAHWSIYPTRV